MYFSAIDCASFRNCLSLALTFPISVVSRFILIAVPFRRVLKFSFLIARQQIDQRFFDTPYYVAPDEPVAQDAFAVIREAMRHKTMVALGRLVLSKHERVIALEPYGKGLLGTTPRYPYEVRDAKDYFADLPELALAPDMLALAAQILESKVADFDPKSFRDRYEEALLAHLKAKQAGAVGRISHCITTPRPACEFGDFKDFADWQQRRAIEKIRHPHSMGVVRLAIWRFPGPRRRRCVLVRGR
jgi:Ku protein